MASYTFTRSAQNDLRDIAKYTSKQWGKDQAFKYASDLDQCFEAIANGNIIEKPVSENTPDIFYHRMQKHIIFYQTLENNDLIILAILHEKMDLMKRLQERLK
tara:strand:+ start:179 stop:487 length:309 start_codon:yes stop_codon:yes gene_type:complete